jgi:hypothetical protein
VLAWLLLTLLPVRVSNAQGTIIFNNRIPTGSGVGQTTHIWGPSSSANISLTGLGSNDSPSGTTAFGAASGMTLIGANGTGGKYGAATTFAQLIGAAGLNVPESSLMPLGQTTTFRIGTAPFSAIVNGGYLNNQDSINQSSFNLIVSVPEPSACVLAGLGVGLLMAWCRRK